MGVGTGVKEEDSCWENPFQTLASWMDQEGRVSQASVNGKSIRSSPVCCIWENIFTFFFQWFWSFWSDFHCGTQRLGEVKGAANDFEQSQKRCSSEERADRILKERSDKGKLCFALICWLCSADQCPTLTSGTCEKFGEVETDLKREAVT